MPAWTDSEVVRLLAISSPPASPLSPWSLPSPRIPFPSLPPILSPPSHILSPAPPLSPIHSLGYRAAMIRLRDEAASTSPPPSQLPFASHREDRPEVTLLPRKRLGIALGPTYEVGESSFAAAARPAGGFREDYGFVATVDREIMRDPEREVGYGITDSWDEIVETLQGAPVSTDTELGGYVREDRRAHAYTRQLMETEVRMSREAWVRATDASDLVHGDVISLRTTVLGQISEIRELQAADCRRQTVISELPRIDHRRSTENSESRTAIQGQITALQGQVTALQAQVTTLQGQQRLAGDPTQPELPEEAGGKARMSKEAWTRAIDASDLVNGEVISLRTTMLGQIPEIRELQAADRRRQTVISELLRLEHRRSIETSESRTALQGQITALQVQVIALQAQVATL
uniref:Uncharacterized protein n=1 Tax=Tanacetum cinerariifolium TaxID=118510 RepID=A0A699HUK0_TANCI|nr:hypothetical protein [Tanacetum cinerariifolium]